ncbi:MAG: isoprenylcysteine carboxylmethyltransferase family protein [Candidatus Omnitrophica bacterium]|jgi:protein-S-isoprenylcysteine O-methyltransferase Ste14|nr:isoprenylcysteine carboxylmethyltransferase family protein [Candidatus Omnitrophota bacterium]
MSIKNRLKRWFKLRFFVTYPFGLFVLFFCSPTTESFNSGIWFVIAGLIMRLWANGYAIKTHKLTTSGPYSIVRNPLYLGTMLIAIGFMILLDTSYVGLVFIIIMAAVYYRTIRYEERALTEKHGKIYLDYKDKVPMILPTFFRYKKGEKWPFSFKRIIENKEYKLFIWVINITIIFRLKGYFLIDHESIDAKKWFLIALFIILAAIDIGGEIFKWNKKRAKRMGNTQ